MKELLELPLENEQCLHEFGLQGLRSVRVDGLHPFWQTRQGWKLHKVGSNGSTASRIAIDGALENGGVCRYANYRDTHAMHGEEPGNVY